MHEINQISGPLRELKDPVLITGFLGQQRGGRLPTAILTYLAAEWHAELIATINSEELYDFSVLRPQVRSLNDKPVVAWPEILIYLAQRQGAGQDRLLLLGNEPHLCWQSFVKTLAGYVGDLGVRTIVNVRSYPAPTPHTRPAPLFVDSPDRELASRFGAPERGAKFEVMPDFAQVLSAQVASFDWRTVDLSVFQPFYIRPMPRAQASIAVIKAIDHAFGTLTSLSSLDESAVLETKAFAQVIAQEEQMGALVRGLEERYDAGEDLGPDFREEVSDLPSGAVVVTEVERFLREEAKPKDSSQT